ncbi:MAG: hypothetical protein KC910_37590, partial [Candidatus Eremiobacteraeota bacterium]|nr:hypothetical protein [Candidatus Eremiobacteraeota bacterium]
MKKHLVGALAALILLSPAQAQDQVLAAGQGYQLKQSDLVPAMNLLAFLVQGQLEPQEVNYLVQAAVTEFQASPAAYLGQLRSLNGSIAQAQGISDPLKLGEFRYKLIGEFYAAAQRVPAN